MTYEDFFTVLRPKLTATTSPVENRYLTYLEDFVVTTENLREGLKMDTELLEFLKEAGRERTATRFHLRMKRVARDLRSKTKRVADAVDHPACFNRGYWGSLLEGDYGDEESEIYDALFYNAYLDSGVSLRLDVVVRPATGWLIEARNPEDDSQNKRVSDWLRSVGVKGEVDDHDRTVFQRYDFAQSEVDVAKRCSELLAGIGNHLGHRELVCELIKQQPQALVPDVSEVPYVRFAASEWLKRDDLKKATDWTSSRLIILFEFERTYDSLILRLVLGPGPVEVREIRKRLFKVAKSKPELFLKCVDKLGPDNDWTVLFEDEFLSAESLTKGNVGDGEKAVRDKWSQFTKDLLPRLRQALQAC